MVHRLETIASSRVTEISIPASALRSVAELEQLCRRRQALIVQLERELYELRQPSDLEVRVEVLEEIVRLGRSGESNESLRDLVKAAWRGLKLGCVRG